MTGGDPTAVPVRTDAMPATLRLATLVMLAYAACVGMRWAAADFDATRFIVAGDAFVTPARLVYPIAVEHGSEGYDGQFFYRLALDPLDSRPDAYGVAMAHPAVRGQRIVYPALAWLAALGRGPAVPYTLIAVNLASIALLAVVAARLAARAGLARRWGLLIPFHPGFVLTIARDTAEIVATLLAVSALAAAGRSRWRTAALLASAAVLTRESTLLYLAGYGLVALSDAIRARKVDARVGWCLVPVLVYAAWQAVIHAIWGSFSIEVIGRDNFASTPLLAYVDGLRALAVGAADGPVRFSVLYALGMDLLLPAFVLFVAYRVVRHHGAPFAVLAPWLGYAAMTLFFTGAIWRDAWGYVRVSNDGYVLGIAILLAIGDVGALRRLVPFVAVAWAASVAFLV